MVDLKTLERLATKIDEDSRKGICLNRSAMRSIADIIRKSIGAPLSWPSREAGADHADSIYAGSPDLRLAFNTGVKWAVEEYQPSFDNGATE